MKKNEFPHEIGKLFLEMIEKNALIRFEFDEPFKTKRIIFLILCREFESLSVFDLDYLPLDLFKIFLSF